MESDSHKRSLEWTGLADKDVPAELVGDGVRFTQMISGMDRAGI